MLTLNQKMLPATNINVTFTIFLTAEKRARTSHRFDMPGGQSLFVRLPPGTILKDGDLLQSENKDTIVQIAAQPEPVMTVTASDQLSLLKAAYHLGSRRIPLEITPNYLRLYPDPVVYGFLVQLGLEIREEVVPFNPEFDLYVHG